MKKNNITIIFSSHLGDKNNNKFINHISNTIGCKHKTICYTNYNQFSLSKIYNKAIAEYSSNNSIMVFCHPDINFKTKNWGRILLDRFNNSDYGILGLAGTAQINNNGIWWEDKSKLFGIINHCDNYREWETSFSPNIKGIQEVVCVDGVFIAVDPIKIFHKFDENYGLFHFYDIPFCVNNYLDGCSIGITTDIRLTHKSVGEVNSEWERNRINFINEFKDEFPIKLDFEIKNLKQFDIKLKTTPSVNVIIPTKNNYDILKQNILSWKEKVKYNNYKIIIADTGSDEIVLNKYDELLDDNIFLIKYDYYNFAKINNDVVKNHCDNTDLLLFCNDDIKLLNDCLSRIIEVYNENENVGTIGIRLHYEDNSVQHNGIYIHSNSENLQITHIDLKKICLYKDDGYYNSIGNTGAFLLIEKKLFNKIGGFNENYSECFEDVELNFECLYNVRKNFTVCDAVAYHYESMSRDKDMIENKMKRVKNDYDILYKYYKNKT